MDGHRATRVSFLPVARNVRCDPRAGQVADDVVQLAARPEEAFQGEPTDAVQPALLVLRHDSGSQVPTDDVVQDLVQGPWAAAADKAGVVDPVALVSAIDVLGGAFPARFAALFCAARVAARRALAAATQVEQPALFASEAE